MIKKIWIHKSSSYTEAQEFDDKYYLSMNSEERLEVVQFLRERHFKIQKEPNNENRKRLRRVIKIIKQT